MKDVLWEVAQAFRASEMRLAFLFYADTADGPVRAWSGVGTLTYDGQQWFGLGQLGRADLGGESVEVRTAQNKYSLAGPQILEESGPLSDSLVRGRIARFWVAVLDEAEQIIGEPILLDESIMDTVHIETQANGEQVLSVTATSAIFDFARPLASTLSNETQQADFPGDTGFDRVPDLVDKVVNWTRT